MSDEQGYWTTSKNACKVFGVTANTIRRWADCNKITYKRTPSNQRIYFIPSTIDQSNYSKIQTKQNVIYCRVSSAKQKDDLQRQCLYLSSKYPDYKIINLDKLTYAGNLENQGNSIINDIILPAEENGTGKRHKDILSKSNQDIMVYYFPVSYY